MSQYDYDLFIIGAGSGGVRAARLAAQTGARVAIAEEDRPGGTCVLRGCVPKKFLVYGAEYGEAIEKAKYYGWTAAGISFDWSTLRNNIQNELTRLSDIYRGIMDKNNVTVYNSRAVLTGKHTIELKKTGETVTAKYILVAVGGQPFVPEIKGREHAIISDDAFLLDELPERILIVGGGYIACEFAGIFAGLGVNVTQAYRGDALLRGFDADVRAKISDVQTNNGIKLLFGASPREIKKVSGGYKVTMDDGSQIGTDLVFMATGRAPYTKGLGLEAAGVITKDNGAIKVDEYSKTNVSHIYAVGDVTDRVALTPVAIREAVCFVETVFKDNPSAYDYTHIPSAVFTRPEVGVVGVTEAEAREAGRKIKVYQTAFRPMKQTLSGSNRRYFMKMITEGRRETVIGIHIIGDDAAEIIQMAGIAVKAGLSKAQFDATCAVHPTAAEELVTLN